MSSTARTVVLAGATGLVGRHCLDYLLADATVAKVIAPTRRPLVAPNGKLENRVVDFGALEDSFRGAPFDQVICCLGTTIKQAGSRERFREVDHDYPLALGRLAKAAGATHYLIVTSMGADENSLFFYNRVKGEVERELVAMNFPALTIVRPSLLLGHREEARFGERLAAPFGRLLPPKWRAIDGLTVARALGVLAREPAKGVRYVESKDLFRIAG
jgi:uncharacterized protein YbjT (DUF2867 family)